MIRHKFGTGTLTETSDNNINRVKIHNHKDFKNISLSVIHKYKGSVENTGLFHLAEHLLLSDVVIDGVEYSTAELMSYAKENNITINAETGSDYISIDLVLSSPKIPPKLQWAKKIYKGANIDVAVKIINAISDHSRKISNKSFKKEKSIVAAEISEMGESDHAFDKVFCDIMGQEFGYTIAGTKQNVLDCTKNKMDNIIKNITHGNLLHAIHIRCDEKRHMNVVNEILEKIDIQCTLKKFKNVLWKSEKINACVNAGPTSLLDLDVRGDIESGTSMILLQKLGCRFTNNIGIDEAIIRHHMLMMMQDYMLSVGMIGSFANKMREAYGFTYGVYNLGISHTGSERSHKGIGTGVNVHSACLITNLERCDAEFKINTIIKDMHKNLLKNLREEDFNILMSDRVRGIVSNNQEPIYGDMCIIDNKMIEFASIARSYDISKIDYVMFKQFVKQNLNKTRYTLYFV